MPKVDDGEGGDDVGDRADDQEEEIGKKWFDEKKEKQIFTSLANLWWPTRPHVACFAFLGLNPSF